MNITRKHRANHPSQEKKKMWFEARKLRTYHPCPVCGNLCSPKAQHCLDCANKLKKPAVLMPPEKRDHIRKIKREGEIRRKHPCIDCGKLICSKAIRCRSCVTKIQWATGARTGKMMSREHAGSWNGGRTSNRDYILILQPEHHRANKRGYVLQHILVWETANGKPLPSGWIIHHLNGIKDDNRPRNLVALPNKKHYLVLQAKAKRIQELEALLNGQTQLI